MRLEEVAADASRRDRQLAASREEGLDAKQRSTELSTKAKWLEGASLPTTCVTSHHRTRTVRRPGLVMMMRPPRRTGEVERLEGVLGRRNDEIERTREQAAGALSHAKQLQVSQECTLP